MRIAIIIGANNVSINVAKTLMDKYEVMIVDSNDDACSRAFKALKSSALVYRGDPSSEDVLNEVGIDKAELFLALSDNDELNYKACSIAKGKGVPLIIARVNNKDNEDLFKELNISMTLSVEDLITKNVESLIMKGLTRALFTDTSTNLTFTIVRVSGDSQLIGKSISYIVNNYGVAIPYIITLNGLIKPSNDYVIEGDNELVIVGSLEDVNRLINDLSSK
ncbi:potassium transporter peripheral membrane component [Vulcanisaeta moutnovskia 768-28]|uniref:Potassium transporter peripheral membrane component n=1 Tax=Vulcanisaeta moutnovskia (strain 768-28) TaxID=985053 RepID=F0QV73_VULM7|nr:TrkA family potassium uptake protein [Vulcanisaeta moutnovskia]ADY00805.1 potassium transporter peripheral membrane component [Vulcanisaeta moutnovskia 768-28]